MDAKTPNASHAQGAALTDGTSDDGAIDWNIDAAAESDETLSPHHSHALLPHRQALESDGFSACAFRSVKVASLGAEWNEHKANVLLRRELCGILTKAERVLGVSLAPAVRPNGESNEVRREDLLKALVPTCSMPPELTPTQRIAALVEMLRVAHAQTERFAAEFSKRLQAYETQLKQLNQKERDAMRTVTETHQRLETACSESTELRSAHAVALKDAQTARVGFDEKLLEVSAISAQLEAERTALQKRVEQLTVTTARETNRGDALQRLLKVKDRQLAERASRAAQADAATQKLRNELQSKQIAVAEAKYAVESGAKRYKASIAQAEERMNLLEQELKSTRAASQTLSEEVKALQQTIEQRDRQLVTERQAVAELTRKAHSQPRTLDTKVFFLLVLLLVLFVFLELQYTDL
jgi:predicted  nucleic acid-binding Zn-ribbon protein